ncbi:uncharacterized protein HD556DRAFT_1468332 [Suillus plorans]|uniref:Uncharacterized protein n=1 Tax=Suillus plorans TaxID=116603 RepID=A0A9P7J6X4_9AGAM|nr:uncharacterized protein HD556DRAFT_1468332 [Suillus plorans]KAG1806328.1 hypothetical protein HD556DRAFT_1468332 [Suillus plorans]
MSVSKRLSIMDALKSLIHSGIEVDSLHWTRFAFLCCCLHIFLIGVCDHEKLTLKEAFSPYLIPSLNQDLREHIEKALNVDMVQLADEFSEYHPGQGSVDQEERSSAYKSLNDPTSHNVSSTAAAVTNNLVDEENRQADPTAIEDPFTDVDANGIPDKSFDTPDCVTSGFGLNGSFKPCNKLKFWNYVDAMLEQLHKSAHKQSGGQAAGYKDAYHKAMVKFLQLDLQEFPGCHKVLSLTKGSQPAWQETIQKKLLW